MTTPIDPSKILRHLDGGTLARREWGDGHRRACLLAALAPRCAEEETYTVCPAEVMPLWLAALTPYMDDYGTADAWPGMVRRYAAVAARWHALGDDGWRRALLGSLIAILDVARAHDRSGSCDHVLALCREGARADDPRWEAAAAGAARAARAAGSAAEEAEAGAGGDRMTDGILAAIEAECARAEVANG